jgi:flagellar hook-associated protein 3 FlgL
MRITNKMLSNDFLYDMNTNLQNLQTIQKQMTSGKEISKPSDDPFKVSRSMQLTTDINANKQYNQNILDASNFLQTTDTSLNQAENVLQRVRELLVSSGNAAYNSSQLGAIKDEINQKVGELSQILNTNFDGKYIFGGTRGNTKPVDVLNPYISKLTAVSCDKAGAAAGSVSGNYTGGSPENIQIKTVLDGTKYGYQVSTDGGANFSSIVDFASNNTDPKESQDIKLGNGLTFHLDASNTNPITDKSIYSFGVSVQKPTKNTQLIYYSKGGGELAEPIQAQVTQSDLSTWQGTELSFKIDGGNTAQSITIPSTPALKTVDDLASSINTQIGADSSLNGKLMAKITKDDSGNSCLKIYNLSSNSIVLDSSTSGALSSYEGKQVGPPDMDMIKSGLNIEISNGIAMKYNVSASDILQFTNTTGNSKDLRNILSSIVNHLDGNNSEGTSADSNAKSDLTNGDLQDITDAINNLLSVRSEIGAKQNRMDSAKSKNADESDNMTEILSKTEDIDITEKTMEYATMQTVYLASLQTSAKVLEPTLLDYLR